MQRITVYQQDDNARSKIDFIGRHGRDLELVACHNAAGPLPELIDEPGRLLADPGAVDLVLSYLKHPDLQQELARLCVARGLVLIASGQKLSGAGVFCPRTCCSLGRHERLGAYGRQFGLPELGARVADGRLAAVEVHRGSPCGAAWCAADEVIGLEPSVAAQRYGLLVQTRCRADPANWDPLWGASPVHAAGRVHARALARAIERAQATSP